WRGPVTLTRPTPISLGVISGIGVDADTSNLNDSRAGHPAVDNSYFTNDFSLTITGGIGDGSTYPADLAKVGLGHLILPNDNTYKGQTFITQGWVTIQSNNALGARLTGFPGTQPGVPDTQQPGVTVFAGASLQLKTLTPASPGLVVKKNITLQGTGIG